MEAAYLQTFFMAQAMEKLLDEGKEITPNNLRKRLVWFSTHHKVSKNRPDNYHTYLYSRIGKWQPDGQAEIVCNPFCCQADSLEPSALSRSCLCPAPDNQTILSRKLGSFKD